MAKSAPVVLFADQDLIWTRPVRSELRRRGARVLTASSLEELIPLARRASPDLVVLDDRLGGDARGAFHERWPEAEILVLTSKALASRTRGARATVPLAESGRLLDLISSTLGARLGAPVAPARPRPLVMCVDDDRFYLNSLSRILGYHGYRVVTYEDPERALEALPEVRPDLLILDVIMPGVDGLDMAEEVHEHYGGRLPIILLTGRGADADIARGYRGGASYYITKPCEPRKVLNIVDYLVGDLDGEERALLESEL